VRNFSEVIMKKGLSIIAGVLLAMGLCSCVPDSSESPARDEPTATHASQVHPVRSQPVCPAQLVCPV